MKQLTDNQQTFVKMTEPEKFQNMQMMVSGKGPNAAECLATYATSKDRAQLKDQLREAGVGKADIALAFAKMMNLDSSRSHKTEFKNIIRELGLKPEDMLEVVNHLGSGTPAFREFALMSFGGDSIKSQLLDYVLSDQNNLVHDATTPETNLYEFFDVHRNPLIDMAIGKEHTNSIERLNKDERSNPSIKAAQQAQQKAESLEAKAAERNADLLARKQQRDAARGQRTAQLAAGDNPYPSSSSTGPSSSAVTQQSAAGNGIQQSQKSRQRREARADLTALREQQQRGVTTTRAPSHEKSGNTPSLMSRISRAMRGNSEPRPPRMSGGG